VIGGIEDTGCAAEARRNPKFRLAQMKKTTRKARVMVVDDSADTALTEAMLLMTQGHIVSAAKSGSEALDNIQEFRPDVVLLDIAMPGMDGYEVARRIRRVVGYETVVIVAISGYGQESDRQGAIQAGIDHHLLKPINQDDLTRILTDWEARSADEPAPR
jgi:CheY-like chemotaxis protein